MTLSDASSAHFTNWAGAASNYATVRFTVPAGQAVLNSSIAWPATGGGRRPPEQAGQARPGRPVRAGWRRTRCRRASAATAARRCCTRRRAPGRRRSSATRPRPAARPGRCGSARRSRAPVVRHGVAVVADAGARARRARCACRRWCRPARATQAARWCSTAAPAGGGPVSVPGHAARPGRRRAGRRRQVQRRADRRQRTLAGRGPGRPPTRSWCRPTCRCCCATSTSTWCSPTTRPTRSARTWSRRAAQTMGYGSSYLTTGFNGGRRAGRVAPAAAVAVHVQPDPRRLDADHRLHLAGARQRAGRPVHRADPVQRGPVRAAAALPDSAAGDAHGAARRSPTRSRCDNTGAAPEDIFLDARLTGLASVRAGAAGPVSGLKLPLAGVGRPARVDRADDDPQRVGDGDGAPSR